MYRRASYLETEAAGNAEDVLRVPGSPVCLIRGSPGRVATPAATAPPPRHAVFSLAAALLSKVSREVVRAELP